jgi:hypothetical protein
MIPVKRFTFRNSVGLDHNFLTYLQVESKKKGVLQ